MIKGIIFDLDGTLLDSMGIWDTLGEDYLLSLGIQPQAGLRERLRDLSLKQAAVYFRNQYHVELSVGEILRGIHSMIENFYIKEVQLKDGIKELLDLCLKNNIQMIIATATDKDLVIEALERLNIKDYFINILTCQEIGHGKDEPDIYLKALEELKCFREEVLVFEDAIYAIKTAKKAGFQVVGVYDQSESNQDMVKELSDYYINGRVKSL